ncbi:recombinase family protein [Streptomyces sp. NPDC056468]|uniref:recombinase family protein n=1 Tax=Streptomyces sp. NPDC056468 TaxID=3345830 RepID=UPI0036C49ECC
MKLLGYIRASTDRQVEDGFGLAAQEKMIRNWCQQHGHALGRAIYRDEGYSGTLPAPERPALAHALSEVEDGQAAGIVVGWLDRLARRLVTQEAILTQVWKNNGRVFTADQGEIVIIRVIRDHLRDLEASASWCWYSFDFTGATFDGGDLSDCHFQHSASFDGAKFRGRTVAFNFTGTRFHGGTVTFHRAEFGGTVFFNRAQFDGGTVGFLGAEFRGARVNFLGAKFRGTHIIFNHADFGGGTVAFHAAEFSAGTVDFQRARFSGGTVGFRDAEFTGSTVIFDNAEFGSGAIATFDNAHFYDGVVTFDGDTRLEPGANVTFEGAEFGRTRIAWGPLLGPAGH